MFQFITRIMETIFDEIEYRVAKRSLRHAGLERKRVLLKKY